MGAYDDEAPRLSEIVRMLHNMDRKFDEFRVQFQNQLNDKVSKERYEPERTLLVDKINNVESKMLTGTSATEARFSSIESRSRILTTTFLSAFGSLIVGAVLLYLGSRP